MLVRAFWWRIEIVLTSIIQQPPFCPVLDDLRQGSYTIVQLNICPDHPCIFQSQRIVDINITSQAENGVPAFDDRHFGDCPADHLFHAICSVR